MAVEIGVPVIPATDPLPDDLEAVKMLAKEVGYPLMLKASWAGGGRRKRQFARTQMFRDHGQLHGRGCIAARTGGARSGLERRLVGMDRQGM